MDIKENIERILSTIVKLLLYDLEITDLNHKNSILQNNVRLYTIDFSLESHIGVSYIGLFFFLYVKQISLISQKMYKEVPKQILNQSNLNKCLRIYIHVLSISNFSQKVMIP